MQKVYVPKGDYHGRKEERAGTCCLSEDAGRRHFPVSYTHLDVYKRQLVYRLDKLQKSTGLDLRVFEDAITFKIALMVVKYMKYMESLEY